MDRREREGLLREAARRQALRSASRYIPHKPTPQQAAFLELPHREALYGGAAGGGKSDALLMCGLQYVHVPGYSALVLRRTYQDLALPGALMDRSHEWLRNTDASWNGQQKMWRFPSSATLQFGYLDTDQDRFRYQGAEFQTILPDELTQFSELRYTYMLSRLRKPATGPLSAVPLRSRGASNPGGIGHDWVKARFVDPGHPDRPFVPAKLDDNPHLDRETYREQLGLLDETTRAQLLDGLWIRDSGGLIYPLAPANLIPALPRGLEDGLRYALAVDLGASEKAPSTAFVVVGWTEIHPTVWVVHSEAQAGMIPSTIAERIMELGEMCGGGEWSAVVVDEGALGKGYAGEFRQRHSIPARPAEKEKKLAFRRHLRGALRDGYVQIVEPMNEALIAECESLEWNKEGTDNEKGASNHLTDALLYGWRYALAYASEPPSDPARPGTPEFEAQEEDRMERSVVESIEEAAEAPWWAS